VPFGGLAVPSLSGLPPDDLVALWKSANGQRFQNYRATFTILNAAVVSRSWIIDVQQGQRLTANKPAAWRQWAECGEYNALRTAPNIAHRTPEQHSAMSLNHRKLVRCVYEYFKDDPYRFEPCAGRDRMHDGWMHRDQ
jgi:Restriction endonuclease AspBHI N-terminal